MLKSKPRVKSVGQDIVGPKTSLTTKLNVHVAVVAVQLSIKGIVVQVTNVDPGSNTVKLGGLQ